MDSVEKLLEAAQGLYVLLVTSGYFDVLKKRAVSLVARQRMCVLQRSCRSRWGLNPWPVSDCQWDRFDPLRLFSRA